MKLIWDELAWEHYLYWQEADRAMLRKINTLLKECTRTPFAGTGKPEALKGDLRGYWSRRINHEHRYTKPRRTACALPPAAIITAINSHPLAPAPTALGDTGAAVGGLNCSAVACRCASVEVQPPPTRKDTSYKLAPV